MAAEGPEGSIIGTEAALAEEYLAVELVPGEERTALCLSGGGIRSAAFALGVLQGLAEHKLLARFHYLSTVSGGGFIGGWLSVLVARLGPEATERHLRQSVAEMDRTTPPELAALRDFTNYLTPRGGPFSLDTWTALVLVVRNMLLNWLVFLPWFLAAVALVTLYREALWLTGEWVGVARLLALVAGAALFLGTVGVCLGLPSHRAPKPPGWDYRSPRQVLLQIVVPALVFAAVLPMTLSRHWAGGEASAHEWALPSLYVAVTAAAYLWAAVRDWRRPGRARPSTFLTNAFSWGVASGAAAAVLWLGLYLGRVLVNEAAQADVLAVLGPLWLAGVNTLHSAVHVALRPEADRAELDREWLARISAHKLRAALLWAVFAACCLMLPAFLNRGTLSAAYAALAAGPVGAWLGKQVLGRAQGAAPAPGLLGRAFMVVPPVLCAVFAAVLFAALGQIAAAVLDGWAPLVRAADPAFAFTAPGGWFGGKAVPVMSGRVLRVVSLLGACGALLFVAQKLGSRINVNRFSLHGVYRNRLTRAFLGSARGDGRPGAEPLTGFDDADIVTMASLAEGKARPLRLFPVVNTTLNLSFDERLAWSERKAASFTVTPLRSGSAALPEGGRFVRSGVYGGLEHPGKGGTRGVRLPGALTISGAAVSPNWGYHSSPLTAFVMTLFNVRLGAWMPNPANPVVAADEDLLAAAMPPNSADALFRELFGRTDSTSEAVYLSDGGHFDNLGLYEMVRRECRFILVVDAGQDRSANLRGLGEAVRKCGVDLGAAITLDRSGIASRVDEAKAGAAAPTGFATGRVLYRNGMEGVLVYLKASWLRGLPVEVAAYGAQHEDFPHESTLDQGFTESQFESYRALGLEQAGRLLRALPKGGGGLRERFGRMV